MTEVSSTVFGIPRSHWHCTLDNFTWPSPGVKYAVDQFMEKRLRGEKVNLLLTGPPGNGKTHLAVALYRWGVLNWGTADSLLIMVPEYFTKVKDAFNGGEDVWKDVESARSLVVLDDILGREASNWERDNVLFRLINTPYSLGASMVVTSNNSLDQMSHRIWHHEMSRLLENTTHVEFKGTDRRLGL